MDEFDLPFANFCLYLAEFAEIVVILAASKRCKFLRMCRHTRRTRDF